MNRVLPISLALLALVSCDNPRRGSTVRIAGCVEGRSSACVCSDGRQGSQVCLANDQFSPCECTGPFDGGSEDEDGGEEDGSIFDKDAGFDDSGFWDSGAGDADSGGRDVGFDDGGFDTGARDTGAGDADAGDGDVDSGARDVGTPDVGLPEAGIPDGALDFDAGVGTPCSTDSECNTGLPFPILICERNACEYGCLFYEIIMGTPYCVAPQTCDFLTGRCI